MNLSHVTLPVTIALWSPPMLRMRRRLGEWLGAAMQRLERAAEQREQRRRARARDALYAQLDARTLRDIGLGDFAVRTRDDASPMWQRTLEQRGW